jgi:hypothetical protein
LSDEVEVHIVLMLRSPLDAVMPRCYLEIVTFSSILQVEMTSGEGFLWNRSLVREAVIAGTRVEGCHCNSSLLQFIEIAIAFCRNRQGHFLFSVKLGIVARIGRESWIC